MSLEKFGIIRTPVKDIQTTFRRCSDVSEVDAPPAKVNGALNLSRETDLGQTREGEARRKGVDYVWEPLTPANTAGFHRGLVYSMASIDREIWRSRNLDGVQWKAHSTTAPICWIRLMRKS